MANKVHNLITVKNTGKGFKELRQYFERFEEYDNFNGANDVHNDLLVQIKKAFRINVIDIANDEYQIQFLTNWSPAEEIFEAIPKQFPEITIALDIMSMESNLIGTGGYGPDYPFTIFGYFHMFDNRESGDLTKITLPKDLSDFFKRFIYKPFNWDYQIG